MFQPIVNKTSKVPRVLLCIYNLLATPQFRSAKIASQPGRQAPNHGKLFKSLMNAWRWIGTIIRVRKLSL